MSVLKLWHVHRTETSAYLGPVRAADEVHALAFARLSYGENCWVVWARND